MTDRNTGAGRRASHTENPDPLPGNASSPFIDTERLLDLARQRSRESREALAVFMADLLDGRSVRLCATERQLISDILRSLIHKVERSVRHRLVDILADNPACPQDLVWFLANEPIDIAYPVLMRSDVLRDMDLIELVRHKAIEHRITIARRPNLSQMVADSLVRHGDTQVVLELLNNESAALADATMAYLVERSRSEQQFHGPLLHRPEMSPELAEKLYVWVSAALRKFILKTWTINPTVIDEGLGEVLHKNDLSPDEQDVSVKADALAEQVARDSIRLRQLVLSAMEGGDIRLVVSLISEALGLRKVLVRRILFEESSESLAIIARALGLSRADFLLFRAVVVEFKTVGSETPKDEDAQISDFFDRVDVLTARAVIAHWGRKSEYLGALRTLET